MLTLERPNCPTREAYQPINPTLPTHKVEKTPTTKMGRGIEYTSASKFTDTKKEYNATRREHDVESRSCEHLMDSEGACC